MSDREMWAYAIIVIGVLVYGAAILRWRYMSLEQVSARRSKRARAKRADNKAAREGHSDISKGLLDDR